MKRFAFLGLAAVVAPMLLADSCSTTNSGTSVGNNSSSESSNGNSSGGSHAQTFKVGDRIKVGNDNFYFSVTGVQTSQGTEFEKPANGQYLIVAVSFDNQSGQTQSVSSFISFELRDATGQSYNETILSTAPKPPDGDIAKGDKLAGALSYDVPKGRAFRLYFKNNVFASGAVVIDLGTH